MGNPPCFHDESTEFKGNQNLTDLVQRVNNQISDFVVAVEDLIKTMANYCVDASDVDGISFIGMVGADIGDAKVNFGRYFCENTTSFLEGMRFHYDTLNLLANYVETLQRKAGDTAKANLRTFQNSIYGCMCKQKTALRSYDHDPDSAVPGGDLFNDLEDNGRCYQQTLQYVIAMDSQRIAEFLKMLYSIFDGKPSVICG